MTISAAMVKELRERTNAGMMECKKALVEANGDMTLAEEILAKYGQKKVAKSASRVAAEGRIGLATSKGKGILLEINCETDFVSRQENFINFCNRTAQLALDNNINNIEELSQASFANDMTVEQERQALVAMIGENIQLRRMGELSVTDDMQLGAYSYQGRIGALVVLKEATPELAKDLAMHVASMHPQFVHPQEVDPSLIAQKQEELMEAQGQAQASNLVADQLQAYLNEICLIGQPFFKAPDQTVATVLKNANAQVIKMLRFEVGEGIEVVKMSFEEEVAQARGGQ